MYKKLFFSVSFFLFTYVPSMFAQDLTAHQWEDRIILLFADSFENKTLRKQSDLLMQFPEKLKERKLVIYEITPTYYRIHADDQHIELGASTLFNTYNKENELFKIILIGLDGSIKLEENIRVKPSKIFGLIDQMPMRKNELRN